MTLSPADTQLLENMRQRELTLKRRQRAADTIHHQERRYRFLLIAGAALLTAIVLTAVCVLIGLARLEADDAPRLLLLAVVGLALGSLVGHGILHTPPGRGLLRRHSERLRITHAGDLHAGRRWSQFFYRDEEISAYIGQILFSIESEKRFDSIDDALAFAKQHAHMDVLFRERGLRLFDKLAGQTTLAVLSTADERGHPSSRFMRFVTTDRPGVWYVTCAPDTPKVHEFDRGEVAVMTIPDGAGGTISSNRVAIRRANTPFRDIAHLYREQAPRYLDGMTEEDQDCELVYELTFASARVDDWTEHEVAIFDR